MLSPRPRIAILCALASISCEGEAQQCADLGAHVESASPADRRLLGSAAEYPADPALAARWQELATSQRARRSAAWEVVARALAPTPLAEPEASEHTVPAFRTYYDREDFLRVFNHLYGELSEEERLARAPIARTDVDDAFLWNVGFFDELGGWPEDRWDAYVSALDQPEALHAIGGVRRVSLSPSAVRHVIESYPEVLSCLESAAPEPWVDRERAESRLLRSAVALDPCASESFGPFAIARGEELSARLEDIEGGFAIEILEGERESDAQRRCISHEACTASGPGLFYVAVRAELERSSAALELARVSMSAPVRCLDGAFPIDAVSIAAEWRRAEGSPLPVYDTSADAIARRFAEEIPTWGEGDGTAEPGPESIHTQRVDDGVTFRLAAFHLRTRELPEWMNITLWWSPDPDTDFGADRPESIRALGGPWSSYKMCVAIDYEELDADPRGGASDESLAAALAAVHEGRGGPTWCSNPYIDAAPGLARGNCVGCHQHAMSGVEPFEVATDSVRFPRNGRLPARNNQPADGFWGLDAGDDLALLIREVVDYWD